MELREFISNTIFFLYLPVIWVLMFFWAYKAKHYWKLAIVGVLAHLAYLPLVGLLTKGQSFLEIGDHSELAFMIVLLVLLALIGITISALVILYLTRHRVWVLAILAAISVITLTPLLDEIDFDPTTYVMSLLQGTETEFQGYKIYLGSSYLYTESEYPYAHNDYEVGVGDSSLSIDRIIPGFEGVDDAYWLEVRQGTSELIKALNQGCLEQSNECEFGDRVRYQLIAFTKPYSDPDEKETRNYYYNLNCDVFLTHSSWDHTHDERYLDFVKRFFNNNCLVNI